MADLARVPPAGAGARPPPGAQCACCRGTDRWSDARGWACATCHPDPRELVKEWEVGRLATPAGNPQKP